MPGKGLIMITIVLTISNISFLIDRIHNLRESENHGSTMILFQDMPNEVGHENTNKFGN
jgi:hypothetical protein